MITEKYLSAQININIKLWKKLTLFIIHIKINHEYELNWSTESANKNLSFELMKINIESSGWRGGEI